MFEKNLDEYGYDERKDKARTKWDESYYQKWKNAMEEKQLGDQYDVFHEVREKLNEFTKKSRKCKENYMLEIVKQLSTEELKANLLSELFNRLEEFVGKIKKS